MSIIVEIYGLTIEYAKIVIERRSMHYLDAMYLNLHPEM